MARGFQVAIERRFFQETLATVETSLGIEAGAGVVGALPCLEQLTRPLSR